MTEERNTAESVTETDALVAQTYREVADERAPDHLNRAVLQEAARAARPRYAQLRSWTRPMAWAATVMLSVALVLQVSTVPDPEAVSFGDGAARFEVEMPETEATDDGLQDAPAEQALEEAAAVSPSRSTNAATTVPASGEAMKAPEKQLSPEPALQKRQRNNFRQGRVEQQKVAAPAANVDEFKLKDADVLRRADDLARMQSGENKEVDLSGDVAADAGAAGLNSFAVTAEAPACDEPATKTPEAWVECIAELEAAGRSDEAMQQRELLQQAFPGFDPR